MSNELASLAESEIRETEEIRNYAIKALRDWTMNNPRIIKTRLDAVWLLRFLRFRKFSIPMAQEAIERYLVLKEGSFGEIWFQDLNIMRPSVEKLFDSGFIFVLPKRDKLGRKVICYRPGILDPHSPTVGNDFKTLQALVYEIILQDEENQIRGIVHLVDTYGVRPSHLTMLSAKNFFRTGKNTERILSMRHKAIHIVNMAMPMIGTFATSHMNTKLRSRTHFYSNFDKVRAINKDDFPIEFGGKIPMKDMVTDLKIKLLKQHQHHLKYKDMKVHMEFYPKNVLEGSVKALKFPLASPQHYEKKNMSQSTYGIQGSFRKLEID
ncbi:unnamed protein product [Diamesa tonsa]